MRFEWDEEKAASNWRKHRVRFAASQAVFEDPYILAKQDRMVDGEERWQAFGLIGRQLYVVAYTVDDSGEEEVVRIISARKATRQERFAYES